MVKSKLILIPQPMVEASDEKDSFNLKDHLQNHLPKLDGIFAESAKGARSWLKSMGLQLPFFIFNRDTRLAQLKFDLEQAKEGTWGYVSDAGYPCIADPGSLLVEMARTCGFEVDLMPGTSSIFAAIALSGLQAQRFEFHGYLPAEKEKLKTTLQNLERKSQSDGSWQGGSLQIFIEAPYRHLSTLKILLETLKPSTFLCIASDIGGKKQLIRTQRVSSFKKNLILNKSNPLGEPNERLAVYLFQVDPKEPTSKQERPKLSKKTIHRFKF